MADMKMITDVSVDLYGEEQFYLVSAKQGDRATRFVRVQLMNNGNEFEIPEDAILYTNIKKPDGKFCYNECDRDGNRVMVQLTNQALAAAGTAHCDIEIRSKDNKLILSSQAFTIEIEKSMRDESAIESSNEMTALENKVQFYIDNILDTKKDILAVEAAMKVAEAARALAEADRIDAETERVRNEKARVAAEITRQQQLTRMQEATTDAKAATASANTAAAAANEATAKAEELYKTEEQMQQMYEQMLDIKGTIGGTLDGGSPFSVDQMTADGGTPFTTEECEADAGML